MCVFFPFRPVAPVAQRYHVTSDTLGREFDPGANEKLKMKIKMPDGWRTMRSLVHKIRLRGRRGKGMAESFSREKLRQAPQKEGGWKILCYLLPVRPRLVRPLKSRMNGKKTHTHILDIKFIGRTSRGHTGGRSHRISHHLLSAVRA